MIEKLTIGIICLILGGLIGHRLALGRDRRKEYNELADDVSKRLFKELSVSGPYAEGMTDTDLHLIGRHLDWLSRNRLSKKYQSYKYSKSDTNQEVDSFGQAHYIDSSLVRSETEKLINHLKRK